MKLLHHLLLAAFAACAFAAENAPSTSPWDVASAGSFALAVPRGWRSFDGIQPAMPIYRQGDGASVPVTDETGSPLQIGLTLETFPPTEAGLDSIAQGIAQGASRNPELKKLGAEKLEPLALSDRTPALLMTTEFIKAGHRRSYYLKLVAKNARGQVCVVTGYLVGGKESAWPAPRSPLAAWLRAHVLSLTATGSAIAPQPLAAAYAARGETEKRDPPPPRAPAAPAIDLTGRWQATWQGGGQGAPEAFTMELTQAGATVQGTALFLDAARTRASIAGEVTGSTLHLEMTPANPSLPKTVWHGAVAGRTITGDWTLHAGRTTLTGAWTATAEARPPGAPPEKSP